MITAINSKVDYTYYAYPKNELEETRVKKFSSLLLAAMLVFAFTACNAAPSSSEPAPAPEPKDYTNILLSAREKEINDALAIIGKQDGDVTFTHNPYEANAEQIKTNVDMTLDVLGLAPEQLDDLGLSVSLMSPSVYCVAIIKPTDGNETAVLEALDQYWKLQQQTYETYLPNLYEIAKDAKLEVLQSGEILFVMCENADAMTATLKEELAK